MAKSLDPILQLLVYGGDDNISGFEGLVMES